MLEYVDWFVLQSVSGNNRHVYYNRDNTHVLTVEYTNNNRPNYYNIYDGHNNFRICGFDYILHVVLNNNRQM